MEPWNKGLCRAMSPDAQAAFLEDVRGGMSGPVAVEKYGVAKTTLIRLLKLHGMKFPRPAAFSRDEQIAGMLRRGLLPLEVAAMTGANKSVVYRVLAMISDDVPPREKVVEREARYARIRELSESLTVAEICAVVGVCDKTVRNVLADAGLVPFVAPRVTVDRPRKPRKSRAKPRVAKPPKPVKVSRVKTHRPVKVSKPRVVREPKPAPIKRPAKPARREPLFFTCGKKHPITPSNRIKGTDKGCVICAKKGLALDPRMAVLRDQQIFELSLIVQAEVAALTADLRPEEEKAA